MSGTEALDELLKLWKSIGPVPREQNEEIWNKFKGIIDKHYADKLMLRQLAARAGLSQVSFSRLFKKIMGITPIRYVTENRLNRARKLLSESDKTLFNAVVN